MNEGCIEGRASETIRNLVRSVCEDKQDKEGNAFRMLIDIGGPAVPTLTEALNDPRSKNRDYIASVLGQIGDRRSVPALLSALDDSDAEVRRSCASALAEMADPRAFERMRRELHAGDCEVTDYAARYFGRLKDPRAVEPLIAIMNNPSVETSIRASAADALGRIGDSRPVESLLNIASGEGDETDVLWESALEALGRLKETRALPILEAALRNKYPTARLCAARGAGCLGDTRMVGHLVALMENRQECREVRSVAAASLVEIGSAAAITAVIQRFEECDDRILRCHLISYLAGSPIPRAYERAILALKEPEARDEVVRFLAEGVLKDPAGWVSPTKETRNRVYAILKDDRVIAILLDMVHDSVLSETTRSNVKAVIRKIGDRKVPDGNGERDRTG